MKFISNYILEGTDILFTL